MSQPGTGRQPPPTAHGDKKASGASSKSGEKNAEAAEKKPAGANVSQPPKMQASGTPSALKKQSPSADASKPEITKPSETKAKSQTSPSVTATSKPNHAGELTTAEAHQPPQATSRETAKAKPEKMSTAGAGAAGTSAAGAGDAGAGASGTSVVTAAGQSSTEPSMDELALDSLIDTLGGPEDDAPASPVYTGPEVTEDISSRYLEEMGKREGSLPPAYVKLLKSKGDGKDGVPPKVDEREENPMTDAELAEALSSDFTCSAAPAEKKSLAEEVGDDAVQALLDTLGGPEPELEEYLSPVVEVSEAKAKEKKEEKAGERDDTVPPEYRLLLELDKDGKPMLPEPEEIPKPLSDYDLVDEFSKHFACAAQPAVQYTPSTPSSTSQKPSDPVSAKTAEAVVVPRATACTVQSSAPSAVSSVGHVADEVLEVLSGSLGKREPDPGDKKPAVDKVQEKTKQEECKKLGEDEETIPPDYRLTEAKDKDGKPLLPKPEEKSQPMSENDLLEGLTKGFSCSPSPSAPLPTTAVIKKTKEGEKPADSSDVIAAAKVSSVHSAAPLASTSGGKEMDEALDLLSDSLGQREPGPDENKPFVDEVKEKAKSEHRDKLGERDDTIPPDYRKLLESGEQGKPVKPTAKDDVAHKEQKKPTDDSAAIDALSGDFDTCAKAPATPQPSKDRSGKETTRKTNTKDKGKPKDPKKANGRSSSGKSEKQKTS
ncbi:calpastatin isoform X19 [Phalacrocorax aristotelis]|uniref:calpastatin isoform X19 n=1 Tax=Phalacrocorax aristotelis TaxID=126867 RepID=UPI003F4C5566